MTFWKKKDSDNFTVAPVMSEVKPEPVVLNPAISAESKPEESSLTSPFVADKLGKVRSALSVGTVIQGKLSFDTPVRIDGKLSGEVFSTDTLIVGESGILDAKIDVQNLIVMGKVKGQITVKESVKLMRGAQLEGVLNTRSLCVEEGAHFDGKCSMHSGLKGEKAHTKIITFDSIEPESKEGLTVPVSQPEAH